MTRWRKVRPVLLFELVSTITSKGWLITTFGMPLFVCFYGGLVSIPAYLTTRKHDQVVAYGVVDGGRILGLTGEITESPVDLPRDVHAALDATGQSDILDRRTSWFQNFVFRPFGSESDAREALLAGRIRGYYVIPADYVATGRIEEYAAELSGLTGSDARHPLGKVIAERLLAGKVTPEISERVLAPTEDTKSWVVTKTGELRSGGGFGKIVRLIVPIAFSILLLVSILMSAGALIQATGTEKENKVVEVLLSSAAPEEILMGKLLGQGIAGGMQITVWFGMVGVAAVGFTTMLAGLGVSPPWAGMLAAVFFFPLAYLFYGSLMLGTGSMGSNQREANQWGMIWAIFAAVPMIFLSVMLEEPHGTTARVLSWLPFSAPTAVVMRLAMDPEGIHLWEIAGSIAVLIVSTWLTIKLSARLFRVGMLLTGARPKFREILRQARLS